MVTVFVAHWTHQFLLCNRINVRNQLRRLAHIIVNIHWNVGRCTLWSIFSLDIDQSLRFLCKIGVSFWALRLEFWMRFVFMVFQVLSDTNQINVQSIRILKSNDKYENWDFCMLRTWLNASIVDCFAASFTPSWSRTKSCSISHTLFAIPLYFSTSASATEEKKKRINRLNYMLHQTQQIIFTNLFHHI